MDSSDLFRWLNLALALLTVAAALVFYLESWNGRPRGDRLVGVGTLVALAGIAGGTLATYLNGAASIAGTYVVGAGLVLIQLGCYVANRDRNHHRETRRKGDQA